MDPIALHIEAVIFCSTEPISVQEIIAGLQDSFETLFETETVEKCLGEIGQKFASDLFAFELIESGGGYQFLTKPAFQPTVETFLKQKVKKRLSTSALETLSIIAYKQPVSRPQLEQIRGVNCDYALQKLLDKELVVIQGKSDQAGRPILYGTSKKFMDHFGINHLNQLPELKELLPNENEIGEAIE